MWVLWEEEAAVQDLLAPVLLDSQKCLSSGALSWVRYFLSVRLAECLLSVSDWTFGVVIKPLSLVLLVLLSLVFPGGIALWLTAYASLVPSLHLYLPQQRRQYKLPRNLLVYHRPLLSLLLLPIIGTALL